MVSRVVVALAALGGATGSPAAESAGDLRRGEIAFQKCYACHSVIAGETGLTGPNLNGVVGRAVASDPDFTYSEALRALPERGYTKWTRAALDAFLTSPEEMAPGTAMNFFGMPSAQERADVIAYLAAHDAGRE